MEVSPTRCVSFAVSWLHHSSGRATVSLHSLRPLQTIGAIVTQFVLPVSSIDAPKPSPRAGFRLTVKCPCVNCCHFGAESPSLSRPAHFALIRPLIPRKNKISSVLKRACGLAADVSRLRTRSDASRSSRSSTGGELLFCGAKGRKGNVITLINARRSSASP